MGFSRASSLLQVVLPWIGFWFVKVLKPTGFDEIFAKTLIFAVKYKYPDIKKPALKAGFFYTCIPPSKNNVRQKFDWSG